MEFVKDIAGLTLAGTAVGYLAGAGGLRENLAWGATFSLSHLVLDQLTKELLNRVEFTRKLVNLGIAAKVASDVTNTVFNTNMNQIRTTLISMTPLLFKGVANIRQLSA